MANGTPWLQEVTERYKARYKTFVQFRALRRLRNIDCCKVLDFQHHFYSVILSKKYCSAVKS